MEYRKIIKLLDATSDNVPKFISKKWIKVYDQSGSAENRFKPSKQIRFKTSMLQSDLCDYSGAYIVVKGSMLHSLTAFQKLIIHLLTMQKTETL